MGLALGKTGQNPGFSIKFKEAVPKTEVLEQPHISDKYAGIFTRNARIFYFFGFFLEFSV
jgi:hypothetical protein